MFSYISYTLKSIASMQNKFTAIAEKRDLKLFQMNIITECTCTTVSTQHLINLIAFEIQDRLSVIIFNIIRFPFKPETTRLPG